MLVSDPAVSTRDPLLSLLAEARGVSADPIEIRPGVYEISHFGSSYFLRDTHEAYPTLSQSPYGVVDNIEQLLAACPELEQPGREFVVTLTRIVKADQPRHEGWRWHKWGPYLGTHDIQCEYIADEEGVEQVFCYQIYEKKATP